MRYGVLLTLALFIWVFARFLYYISDDINYRTEFVVAVIFDIVSTAMIALALLGYYNIINF